MENRTISKNYKTGVYLTVVTGSRDMEPGAVRILASEFIAYDQKPNFTRLRLTGGKTVDVKETTDQIDRLMREPCSS